LKTNSENVEKHIGVLGLGLGFTVTLRFGFNP